MLHTSVPYQHFLASLPRRPYATDDFSQGLYHLSQPEALASRYIQPDRPYQAAWLKFDLDHPEAGAAWIDHDLPPPNLLITNPASGRAHYLYGLATPVVTSVNGRTAPIKLLAAVEAGLSRGLQADPAYTSLICKNPLHPSWHTTVLSERLYELAELLEAVPRGGVQRAPERQEWVGYSRNMDLFNATRHWAYQHAGKARAAGDFDRWLAAVLARACQLNAFGHPLPLAEVRSTARSVARWTWRNATVFNTSPLGGIKRSKVKSRDRPLLLQSDAQRREQEGAEHTARVKRSRTFDALSAAVAQLAEQGNTQPTKTQVAAIAGVSTETVKRWWREQKAGEGKH